ncbi:MAG: hypothetical protein WBB82_02900 [Limnothrix sp.]
MAELFGELKAYCEPDWGDRVAFAFHDPNRNVPIFLENGQLLKIYDRRNKLLWSGKIQFVPKGHLDRHTLNTKAWSDSKQKGVSYHNWMTWFWSQPPLKAQLTRR